MISFVITIADLFTMDSGFGQEINFKQNKHRLVIPVYQREYEWENERIATLLSDISQNSKFIGNTILDESDERYEIVDGQQRITTCFLTLVALYNHYQGHQLEQETIQRKLIPFGRILLENDSIGDYVELQDGKYVLTISADSDIYGQAEDFERAYQLIEDYINALGPNTRISDFKQKLLDSRMLVLINDQHDRSHPVEQLFLDINEKAQLLKVEDIFKGHCFEKFEAPLYPALRNKWANLKRNASLFKKYGFEDTSEYIYTYLLETDSSSLPKNLTISGKHYIEEKTMDETNVLLTDMIGFGEKVNQFYKDLRLTDYRFVNLCRHSYEYRNTNDHLGLKHTLLNINQEKLIKAGGEEAELLQARIKELIELISVSKEQLRTIESKDDSDEQLTTDNNLHKAEQEYQYYEQQIAKATRTNAALRKKIIVEELVRAIRNRATSDLKAEIVRKTNEKLKRVITDDFIEIESIDRYIKLDKRDGASEGQTLSIAYCFLGTLFEDSELEFPFVIDSPTGKMDFAKRQAVADIIPHVFNQMVAFVQSAEVERFADRFYANKDSQYITIIASPTGDSVEVHKGIEFFDSYQREHKGDEQ